MHWFLLANLGVWGLGFGIGGQEGASSTMKNPASDPSTCIWFSSPATKWDEALPVGNGRLGGMVFGTVAEERIQLNESTYWSGGPYSTVVPGGYKALPEIQRLVFAGKYLDAHNLFGRKLMGYPVEQQKYQPRPTLEGSYHNSPWSKTPGKGRSPQAPDR